MNGVSSVRASAIDAIEGVTGRACGGAYRPVPRRAGPRREGRRRRSRAPLAAEALLARGGLEQQDGDLDAARATLVAAAQLAGSARDDAMLAHVLVTFGGVLVERAEVPARANANDVLYQDVAVPAGTTRLVLTGYHEVRSGEGAGVFDRGKIELVEVGGAVIEQALALDNSQRTTAWTPIAVTLGAPHGGETVRLRLSTSSNASNETSFFFDSLALTATSCL